MKTDKPVRIQASLSRVELAIAFCIRSLRELAPFEREPILVAVAGYFGYRLMRQEKP